MKKNYLIIGIAALVAIGALAFGGGRAIGGNSFSSFNPSVIIKALLPATDVTYDIGSQDKRWATGYFNTVSTTNISITGTISATNLSLTSLTSTNIYSTGITGKANLTSITSTNIYSTGYTGNGSFGSVTSTNIYSTGYQGSGTFSNVSSTNWYVSGLTNLLTATLGSATTTNLAVSGALKDWTGSPGTNGYVLKSTGTSSIWVTTSSLGITGSPLTTLGDLYVFSTVDDRLPVGADGKVLTASSGAATGIAWAAAGAATAGGNDTEVQWNDDTVLNGDSTFTFNSTTKMLTIGDITATDATSTNIYVSGVSNLVSITGNANLTSITSTNIYSLGITGKADLTSISSTNANFTLVTGNANLTNASSTNLYASGVSNLVSLTAAGITTTNFSAGTPFSIDADGIMIPNSAAQLTTRAGAIGIDTTSNQLRYYGTATTTLVGYQMVGVTVASTSWVTTATTTIPLGVANAAETWATVVCYTDTATATVEFGDGTNKTVPYTATSSPTSATLSANNTFTAMEKRYIEIGGFTGTPNYLSCSIKKSVDSD